MLRASDDDSEDLTEWEERLGGVMQEERLFQAEGRMSLGPEVERGVEGGKKELSRRGCGRGAGQETILVLHPVHQPWQLCPGLGLLMEPESGVRNWVHQVTLVSTFASLGLRCPCVLKG